MPELPEVEIIKRGILKDAPKTKIQNIELLRSDLRFPLPKKNLNKIKDNKIINIDRRGKFLIFRTTSYDFISHLGMTGHWRFETKYKPQKHDHVIIHWPQKSLIYNDPRRFGYILNYTLESFNDFGPDPITDKIDVLQFAEKNKKSSTNIKSFLLNQKNILGIGNIYASEILFKSKLNPLTCVNKLKLKDWENIIKYTEETLSQAIQLGGSSLKDYRNVNGEKGDMQNHWLVYGQASKPCPTCKTQITHIVVSNRSTYFCSRCQK